MIEAKKLTKSFGAVCAVGSVSFTVQKGEAVGFLGPNGAGKTTTLRMLAGTLAPDTGDITIAGFDLSSEPLRAKRMLGYMAENPPLYPELTGAQYLTYRAELRGVGRARRAAHVREVAARTGALASLSQLIGHLSKGHRQRLALADALVGDPPTLLLDEPTSGLDPNQVLETRRLIHELRRDHAVILSTHVLSEVEATCSRAIVIDRGIIVAEGSLSDLKRERTTERGAVHFRGSVAAAQEVVVALQARGVTAQAHIDDGQGHIEFDLATEDALHAAVQSSVQAGLVVTQAAPHVAPLDEVFARLTREGTA